MEEELPKVGTKSSEDLILTRGLEGVVTRSEEGARLRSPNWAGSACSRPVWLVGWAARLTALGWLAAAWPGLAWVWLTVSVAWAALDFADWRRPRPGWLVDWQGLCSNRLIFFWAVLARVHSFHCQICSESAKFFPFPAQTASTRGNFYFLASRQ